MASATWNKNKRKAAEGVDDSSSPTQGKHKLSGERRGVAPSARFDLPEGQLSEDDPTFQLFGEHDLPGPNSHYLGHHSTLPTRALRDFTIFDVKDRNALVSLSRFSRLASQRGEQDFRASGIALSAKSEVDPDDDDEEDLDLPTEQLLTLTTILGMQIDYASSEGLEIYIMTRRAWYKLEKPSKEYSFYYAPFWKRHYLVHCAIYAVMVEGKPNMSVEDLIKEVKAGKDPVLDNLPWNDMDTKNLVGRLKNELTARARRFIVDPEERELFLNGPLISKLAGGRASRADILSDTPDDVDEAPLPKRRKTARSSAPPAHMMPFTGYLAERTFNAKFILHGERESPESLEDRRKMKKEAERWIKSQSPDHPAKWIETIGQHDMNWNSSFIVVGEHTFRVGDFALMAPEVDELGRETCEIDPACKSKNSIVNDYSFVQIRRIEFLRARGWHFHARFLRPAQQTVLQEFGHTRELMFTDICGSFRNGVLVRPISVKVSPSDSPTPFVEPLDDRVDSLSYFVRYLVSPDGSFLPLPPEIADVAPGKPFECACTEAFCRQRDAEEPQLWKVERPSLGQSPVTLQLGPYHYRLFDFVYLRPSSSSANSRVYQIGQILELRHWEAKVRLFGRHEELARKENSEVASGGPVMFEHPDLLYLTEEKKLVPTSELVSPCHVCHDLALEDDIIRSLWAAIDGFRVRRQLPRDAAATVHNLIPLDETDFVSCSKEMAKEEEELMRKLDEFPEKHRLNCYDMYHGAGGWSLGFANVGYQVIGGIDLDPHASMTFKKLHPNAKAHNMDARLLLDDVLTDKNPEKHPKPGEVDFFLTGPPCQDFTGLNRFKSRDDSRKALVAVAMTMVEYFRPGYVLMENVLMLLNTQLKPLKGPPIKNGVHKFIMRSLTGLGYNVRWKIYETAHFGAPQNRARLIYVAAQRHLPFPAVMKPTHARFPLHPKGRKLPQTEVQKEYLYGAPHYPFTVRDAIVDLPAFDWKLPEGKERRGRDTPESLERREKRRANGVPEFESEVASNEAEMRALGFPEGYQSQPRNAYQRYLRKNHDGPPKQHITQYFSPINVERIHGIGWGANADHRSLPPILQLPGLASIFSTGAWNHNYFPGLYARVPWDGYFQTVVTHIKPGNKQGRCLHPSNMRVLSVRECARAQGFPDDMDFISEEDDPTDMHRMIGNAVPVPLAEALAREVRRAIINASEDDIDTSSSSSGD